MLNSELVVPIGDIDGEAMTLTSSCQCECGTDNDTANKKCEECGKKL